MRNLLLFTLLVTTAFQAIGQEFTTYDNGLIYSKRTMFELRGIVDSLNLTYKTCDLNRTYASVPQAQGFYISLTEGNMKEAFSDMKDHIPLKAFREKYPVAEISDTLLVISTAYTNRDQEEKVRLFSMGMEGSGNSLYCDADVYKEGDTGYYVVHYPANEYSKEYMEAYYIPQTFHSAVMPSTYAHKVGYADCLIDTTTSKFTRDATYGNVDMPDNWEALSDKKKEKLLSRMRQTRVMGMCSMDDSPRRHAVNMAVLSAATVNWQVFLRAHLDIMNDRFERLSDGNYAWTRRQTYIKELEELNIQVLDLMIGISLRTADPAEHHYTSSVSRTARALSETRYPEVTEATLLAMVTDAKLDVFNRLIGFYLISGYADYLEDETHKARLEKDIAAAVATLPEYITREVEN
ncbi:hypothetical protein AB9P05_18505 [Roseivirga sp. BDSF3-8]|uniref:hypothetical protein n=1 Tax=Roseivirga sp. BDSF3-8 TaxID=3241598 RepID=UPI00353271B9